MALRTKWQILQFDVRILKFSSKDLQTFKSLQQITVYEAAWSCTQSKNLTLGSWSCLSSSKRQIPIKCKALCTWASEKHLDLRLSALSKINFIKLIKTSLSMIFNKGRNCLVNFGGLGGGVHSGSPASFLLCLKYRKIIGIVKNPFWDINMY